jgi:ABC-type nitrate/sulfonate/bicarbonate transport system permease component
MRFSIPFRISSSYRQHPARHPGKFWLSFLSLVGVILLWELALRIDAKASLFYPQPSAILKTLVDLSASGELWSNLGISLARITLGFLIGALSGVVLGLLMGVSSTIRALFEPWANLINPIPKIALIPFVVTALRFTGGSFIMALVVCVLPLVALDTLAAVTRIETTPTTCATWKKTGLSANARWQPSWAVAAQTPNSTCWSAAPTCRCC